MSGKYCRKSEPISIPKKKNISNSNEYQKKTFNETGSSLKKSYSNSSFPYSPIDDTPPNSLRSKYMTAFASLYLMTESF